MAHGVYYTHWKSALIVSTKTLVADSSYDITSTHYVTKLAQMMYHIPVAKLTVQSYIAYFAPGAQFTRWVLAGLYRWTKFGVEVAICWSYYIAAWCATEQLCENTMTSSTKPEVR